MWEGSQNPSHSNDETRLQKTRATVGARLVEVLRNRLDKILPGTTEYSQKDSSV